MDRIRLGSLWALAIALTLFSALLSLPANGQAATITVSHTWVNPAVWSDGTPLDQTAITQTRIAYGTCSGSGGSLAIGTVLGQYVAQGGSTHMTSPALPAGTYCFQAFTTATDSKTGKGVEGDPSDVATNGPQPAPPVTRTPGAPTAFTAKQN